jgi:hypothetical protein
VGVKHTTKKNDYPNVKKQLELINGTGVEVGVLKGEHAWLAGIHEYGCTINVTPKMRAWFRHQGVHLKKSTTQIHIPERSFIRTGYDQNRDQVLSKAGKLLADVAEGKMTARGCYQAVGLELSSKIKDYAIGLQSPPNSGFTTGRKGSSNPLVDTGDMIGGITWRVAK